MCEGMPYFKQQHMLLPMSSPYSLDILGTDIHEKPGVSLQRSLITDVHDIERKRRIA